MKLINADFLMKHIAKHSYPVRHGTNNVEKGMTITGIKECICEDELIVEIVHCYECKLRKTEECAMYYKCNCGEQHTWENDNDYCSWGLRQVSGNESSNC